MKTAITGSGTIEVHRLSSPSTYSAFDIHEPSGFSAGKASNGTFTIDNGDLCFMKTKSTDTGFIEVYMAGHQKRFANIEYHATSTFYCDDASDGYLTVCGGDLYLIKTRDTGSGKVEVYATEGGKNYEKRKKRVTWFSTGDDKNGNVGYWNEGRLILCQDKEHWKRAYRSPCCDR